MEKNSGSKNHYWFWVFQNPPRTAGNTWNGQFLDSDWVREGIYPDPVAIKINQAKDRPHTVFWAMNIIPKRRLFYLDVSWTCFWHCKHHSETKSFQFAHVLTSQTSVFEMKNSFNLDMLCPLQTSFWTIKICRCSRNSLHKDCFMDFVFVNCFQKLNCTKVVYWKLQLVLGTFVSRRDFEQNMLVLVFAMVSLPSFFLETKLQLAISKLSIPISFFL